MKVSCVVFRVNNKECIMYKIISLKIDLIEMSQKLLFSYSTQDTTLLLLLLFELQMGLNNNNNNNYYLTASVV
jgi:hypothetical protein